MLLLAASLGLSAPAAAQSPTSKRGVPLSDEQIRTIEAVTGPLKHAKASTRTVAPRFASLGTGKRNAPARVNPSGSSIQGWRTLPDYTTSSDISGWYELALDGSQQMKWSYTNPDSGEAEFPFVCGVYRNGRVYGFNSMLVFSWLFWGRGSFGLDGTIYDYNENEGTSDLSEYTFSLGYDSLNDTGYAYTLNEDGSAYMFRSFDFDTWTFTTLNDNVFIEDVCPGFAYNPVDGLLYGITTDGRFVTISKENGALTTISNTGLPVTTQLCGFTYSPLDKRFVLVHSTGVDSSTMVTINPADGEMSDPIELQNTVQYCILITPDVVIDPKAPETPVIGDNTFAAGSLSGEFTVTLPTRTFDESPLTSALTLIAYVDGTEYSRTTGQPGATLTVPFSNITEGNRSFSFAAEQNGLKGASVEKSFYVGYDTPVAPQNVVLEEGKLSWDAVTEGVNGGYIDLDNLSYNAYLDGVKLNSTPITTTTYTFTMPDGSFTTHAAQIEAVNHDHVSARTLSNNIAYGDPLPLPVSFTPTETEKDLFTILFTKRIQRSWRFTTDSDGNKYFWCNTNDYSPSEEREILVLPPVNVPATDNLLQISFDVKGGPCEYIKTLEDIAVFTGNAPTREALIPVKAYPEFVSPDWTTINVYTKATEGTCYVGIGVLKGENAEEVMVRNMRVSVSDKPSNTPAAVTALTATPAAQGVLKATVEFDLPVVSLSGSSLEGTQVSATVACGSQTKKVTGTAGSHQSVEVATQQGFNTVAVTPSNVAEGEPASVSVYTGLDIPSPISVMKVTHTQDFSGLVFNWEAPTTGVNGGYIVPADVKYNYCFFNPEEYQWEIAGDLGTATTYTYTQQVPDTLAYSQVGFLTRNDAGNANTLRVDAGMAGKPLTLPLAEDFSEYGGIYSNYYYLECPDESYTDFFTFIGAAYPNYIDVPAPNGGEAAFIATNANEAAALNARVALPVFSTVGKKDVALEIPFYCSPNSAEIKVSAEIYGSGPREIGSFVDNSFTGWRNIRIILPDEMLNQQWVILTLEARIQLRHSMTIRCGKSQPMTWQ